MYINHLHVGTLSHPMRGTLELKQLAQDLAPSLIQTSI